MKFLLLSAALILFYGRSEGVAIAKSDNCQIISAFAGKALAEIKAISPPGSDLERPYNSFKLAAKGSANIDIESAASRDSILCKLVDSASFRELHAALPQGIAGNYARSLFRYQKLQKMLGSKVGGYTNIERMFHLAIDAKSYREQLKPGKILKEKVDLETLTDFAKKMQVKYGSRWVSLLLLVEDHTFMIEDPEVFAKKLYECNSPQDVKAFTGLDDSRAGLLFFFINGEDMSSLPPMPLIPLIIEGINILGDMGLFNLEP